MSGKSWSNALLGFLTLVIACHTAQAIEINVTYNPNASSEPEVRPANDPTGERLLAMFHAAAEYWENIFLDDQTFNLSVVWNDSDSWSARDTNHGGGNSSTSFSSAIDWYFDDSESMVNHGEFGLEFNQAQNFLYQNASTAEQADWFRGNVPGALEYGYLGTMDDANPASTSRDAFSVALRSIGVTIGAFGGGHLGDGYWDLMPVTIGGRSVGLSAPASFQTSLYARPSLLHFATTPGERKLPSTADILALARPNLLTNVNLPRKDFIGGPEWHDTNNWIGNRLPSTGDDVYLRNGDGLDSVTLGNTARMQNLFIGERTWLFTANRNLIVGQSSGGMTIVDGAEQDTRLHLDADGSLQTGNLTVQNAGSVLLRGGEAIVFDDRIKIADESSRISGWGRVTLFGGQRLINDGRIVGSSDPGQTLTFTTTSGGTLWDLDGANGDGAVEATFGDIEFINGGIRDAFDGMMKVGENRRLSFGSDLPLNGRTYVESNGELSASGVITLGSDGVFSSVQGNIVADSIQNSGSMSLSGDVDVESELVNSNFLSINFFEPGDLQMTGDFRQATGWLYLDLHGYETSQFDSLSINGTAILDGQLRIGIDEDFLPVHGSEFTVITATDGIVGEFSFDIARGLPEGLGWVTLYEPNSVTIRLFDFNADFDADGNIDCDDIDQLTAEIISNTNTRRFDINGDGVVDNEDLEIWLSNAAALNGLSGPYLPGDANLDGSIDVSDFNIWNANKFTTTDSWCSGDFNADGVVDVADFNSWNANKFLSSSDASFPLPHPVPEPPAFPGFFVALLTFCCLKKR